MRPIRDAQIFRLIEQIAEHYRSNISNQFIRPVLMQLSLDKYTWDQMEVLTEKTEQFKYHGYHLDDLYRQISASAKFIYATRREVAPTLRFRVKGSTSNDREKILRDMALANFSHNLQLFADLLYDLYVKLVEIDVAASKGRRPVYKQMPELADLGNQLVNN